MTAVMAGAYVLVALWELIPWQRRPFWSGLVLAFVIGVGIVLWLRLVMAKRVGLPSTNEHAAKRIP